MAVVGTQGLKTKSGSLPAVAFSGTPKVASVTFATPFSSASYSVVVDIEVNADKTYAHAIQTRTAGGFVISLCADTLTGLSQVNWLAIFEGET